MVLLRLSSKTGVAAWGWHEETIGNGGVAWVQCTLNGKERLARTTFRVTG